MAFPRFGSWGDHRASGVCTESLVAGVGEDLNPDRRVEKQVDEACGPCLGDVVHRARPGLAAEEQPTGRIADRQAVFSRALPETKRSRPARPSIGRRTRTSVASINACGWWPR